jgi:hypothetical protein
MCAVCATDESLDQVLSGISLILFSTESCVWGVLSDRILLSGFWLQFYPLFYQVMCAEHLI